ncbi:MAG TPA: hypothetical protein VI750_12380 [Pyrinomonadaceae bacterium]|nr:hypothetical protein [Pyrinomonadaceae bacterium]
MIEPGYRGGTHPPDKREDGPRQVALPQQSTPTRSLGRRHGYLRNLKRLAEDAYDTSEQVEMELSSRRKVESVIAHCLTGCQLCRHDDIEIKRPFFLSGGCRWQ